jgi:AbrB family looped-hinge helix DNA binding protein
LGRTRVDDRGRLLLPVDERKRLGLKPGTELEIAEQGGMLVLKPVIPRPLKVRSRKGKWGRDSFLDAGEATFGH